MDVPPVRPFVSNLVSNIIRGIRQRLRGLIAYDIIFGFVQLWFFAPLVAWIMERMYVTTGNLALSNSQIALFLLSPLGIVTLVGGLTIGLSLLFVNHAGLLILASGSLQGQRFTSLRALWLTLKRIGPVFRVGLWYSLFALICIIPALVLLGLIYSGLLGEYDINFYLSTRPPVFIQAVVLASLVAIGLLIVLATLHVRWIFALPVCLFEGYDGTAALRQSALLVKDQAWRIAFVLVGWNVLMIATTASLGFLLRKGGAWTLTFLGDDLDGMLLVIAGLLVVYTASTAVSSFVGRTVRSFLVMNLYTQAHKYKGTRERSTVPQNMALAGEARAIPKLDRGLFWGLMIAVLVVTSFTSYALIADVALQDEVEVTAHRGSSKKAPENSMSAIMQAIDDGADYAEIDVQETADGIVVVLHDADLMKVAGLQANIWDLTLSEVQALDAGSWFGSGFKGEKVPTLEEVIRGAKGQLKLNIELKYNGNDDRLAERVVELIEKYDCVEDCVITSLEYDGLMEVREINPNIRIGFIVSVAVGRITRLPVDFLSLNSSLATSTLLVEAKEEGLEIHVWTINNPRQMERMIDMGVDNIITDYPDVLVDLLSERASLDEVELLLLKVRNWLAR